MQKIAIENKEVEVVEKIKQIEVAELEIQVLLSKMNALCS